MKRFSSAMQSGDRSGASRRRFLQRSAAALGALSSAPFLRAAEPELEALYRAAREEGSLSFYGGGPMAVHRRSADAFSQAFPGIKVEVAAGFSNVLAPRIDAQIAAGRLEVDVAMLQTLQDFERWKRAGALLPYRPAGSEQIPDGFKDPDATSIGVAVYAVAYAYNPERVRREDAPKSALDILNSRFSGQIISTYPHDDDITLYLYRTIVQKYGWDFMQRFMANKPRFIRGHLGVAREIAQGRAGLSFDATTSTTYGEQQRGGKIELVFPAIDRMPIWANSAAIFRGAPHPNAARLFLSWTISRERQSRLPRGIWPTRRDVAPPQGLRPITDYNLANGYREFIIDEPRVVEMRRRFETYIGPVKGEPVI